MHICDWHCDLEKIKFRHVNLAHLPVFCMSLDLGGREGRGPPDSLESQSQLEPTQNCEMEAQRGEDPL